MQDRIAANPDDFDRTAITIVNELYGNDGNDLSDYFNGVHDAVIDYGFEALKRLVKAANTPPHQNILMN